MMLVDINIFNIALQKIKIEMLRSHQEEQIKYFYLDRKFGSGSLGQIGDALDEIDLYLGRMKKLDLINSLVMRMLDLIQTAKSFHIKERVSGIFRHHAPLLLSIHSKDQIAAVLGKCLKGSDQYTRIVVMQMVGALPNLFLKDIAVYHTLLSKISLLNALSREQKKEAILCLTNLLPASRQLSKLFSKNMNEIQEQYQIPLHLLIYLLTYVTIDSHMQKQILESVQFLINNFKGSNLNTREIRKEIYYFQKLVINYAAANYRIVELYEARLKQILPNIQKTISKIKAKKYPFMKNVEEALNNPSTLKVQEFIDELYQRKKEGERLNQYQKVILDLLNECVRNPCELKYRILLVYFLQHDINQFDKQVLLILQRSQQFWGKYFLKQMLSVGLFECSRLLLGKNELFQSNYILFKLYIQFKIADSSQSLVQFIEVMTILDNTFSSLFQCWSIVNRILENMENNHYKSHNLASLYDGLNEKLQLLNNNQSHFSLKQQLQVISIFLHNKQSSIFELKSKCYHIIPSCILDNRKFWFAYLNKQTILSLFKTLL